MHDKTVLIVDDEALARARLIKLLGQCPGYSVCGEAENGSGALQQAGSLNPDIVLLDIEMPGITGLEAAAGMVNMPAPPAIIFCTAYDAHTLEAFEVAAAGYLLKPIKLEKLQATLEKASKLSQLQRSHLEDLSPRAQHRLVINGHKGMELIPLDEIYCCIAEDKYVTVIHQNGESICDKSLKSLEDSYGDLFLRVHRKTLVATHRVLGLDRAVEGGYCLRVDGLETKPQVSRRHLAGVKAALT